MREKTPTDKPGCCVNLPLAQWIGSADRMGISMHRTLNSHPKWPSANRA